MAVLLDVDSLHKDWQHFIVRLPTNGSCVFFIQPTSYFHNFGGFYRCIQYKVQYLKLFEVHSKLVCSFIIKVKVNHLNWLQKPRLFIVTTTFQILSKDGFEIRKRCNSVRWVTATSELSHRSRHTSSARKSRVSTGPDPEISLTHWSPWTNKVADLRDSVTRNKRY